MFEQPYHALSGGIAPFVSAGKLSLEKRGGEKN